MLKAVIEIGSAIISLLTFGFYIGRWYAETNHRIELMEIQQEHNIEITNLKLDYNQRLIEADSKSSIEIARLNNEINSLKSELSHGK